MQDVQNAIAEKQLQFEKLRTVVTKLRPHEKGILGCQIMNLEGVPANIGYDLLIEVVSMVDDATGKEFIEVSENEVILN